MIKVVILTDKDFAGSAFKLYKAIKRFSRIDIRIFTGYFQTIFQHPRSDSFILNDLKKTQSAIDFADIVHIKGDWPASILEEKFGIRIKNPIIQTVSGSYFRRKEYPIETYRCDLMTSFEPDLLLPGMILTPYPIDTFGKQIKWTKKQIPVFTHFPSSKNIKDTDFILKVFKELKKKMEFKLIIPRRRVSFNKAMEMRLGSSIYFDQFGVGAYGNAAVEMMAYGIPIACWIPYEHFTPGSPVMTTYKHVEDWVDMILKSIDSLEDISQKTKQWCEDKHSFTSVENQWYEIYANILQIQSIPR